MTRIFAHRHLFRPTFGNRVELQCYRLINVAPRHYSSKRPSPQFNSARQPSVEELFRDAKTKSNADASDRTQVAESSRLHKYGIRPWRLILVSIVAYAGYRLYYWQTNPHRSLILNGKYFTPFLLESKDRISSTSTIFNLLSLPAGQNTYNIDEAWNLGVWSVQVMQPELQIARSYTPLPPNDKSPPEEIRLLVRKEPQGEVSGFLHRISSGTIVHLRGPHPEYRIPNDVDEILFLAGGTGIAPALQVAHSLYTVRQGQADQQPKMRVLWANRKREDSYAGSKPSPIETSRASIMARVRAGLAFEDASKSPGNNDSVAQVDHSATMSEQSLLVEEVEALKSRHRGKVDVEYFVDEENTFITKALLNRYLADPEVPRKTEGRPGRKIVLVSGPEGFVNSLAGEKGMQKGRETQGPLGGILKEVDASGWEVWKL